MFAPIYVRVTCIDEIVAAGVNLEIDDWYFEYQIPPSIYISEESFSVLRRYILNEIAKTSAELAGHNCTEEMLTAAKLAFYKATINACEDFYGMTRDEVDMLSIEWTFEDIGRL